MLKVSVIIPTYNSWLTLKECIKSIQNQSSSVFELIIVDNASTDNTSENIEKYFPLVKLVRNKTNMGVTGGRNAGIRVAHKNVDYLLFFDHDMVADPKMIEELLKVIHLNRTIGIVTPKIYYFEDKTRIWSAGTGINLWTGQVLFRGGVDIGQYDDLTEVQVAPAAMLVKKKVLDTVVEFDERYFATYEDTDFCFRTKMFGFQIFYVPQAFAYHMIPSDPKKETMRLLSRAYWIGRNRVIFMKDFGKSFLVFLFFIPVFSVYYLNLAIKYKRIGCWFNFIKGTTKGVFT